jgi:ABC-type multidrug transport system fused ATPase/permease subunit
LIVSLIVYLIVSLIVPLIVTSGKSSLILALFRLVEPCGGSIVIDGLDVSSLGLAALRKAITIIPQVR